MLLSMTGHGEGQIESGDTIVAVELRTINSRYFKLSFRTHEGYYPLEPRIEAMIRKHVRRGTVNANLRIVQPPGGDDYKLNEVVLEGYRRQLAGLSDEQISICSLLSLPGVVSEHLDPGGMVEKIWPLVKEATAKAIASLAEMRVQEGEAMARDLATQTAVMAERLDAIDSLAPGVADVYRVRLMERMNKMLEDLGSSVEPADVAREVAVFAERADISEEIVRLRSHLQQFADLTAAEQSNGRKLEFLTQEMFRETNTIGSKGNSAEIAADVIEIKAAIERIREMIQNVE